jgi:hypothetical protein
MSSITKPGNTTLATSKSTPLNPALSSQDNSAKEKKTYEIQNVTVPNNCSVGGLFFCERFKIAVDCSYAESSSSAVLPAARITRLPVDHCRFASKYLFFSSCY